MCLVNQHGELLPLEVSKKIVVEDVIEFMDGGNNNFGVATKGDSQVLRIASVIHNLDLSAFMLDAENSLL